ncbi:formyl transferase [Streptomyces sp. 1331.2]|uniref:formyl transferase n=1 Tax=Streptomyces sp. 1331.2 TaxID=1938835 RepID=UPI000BCA2951|nr:formyl transferase [Streptomyces sp. 1331.2]SOB79503.1 Formyl transferase [Streptomyces sp. 1331.2]
MTVERRNGNEWHLTPEAPGARLRVAVLCSDDPHHRYLVARIARDLDLVGLVVEPGAAQQSRLWARRAWTDAVARGYQVRRQRYTGRSAYRRRYFAALTRALTPPLAPPGEAPAQAPAAPSPSPERVLRVDWINSPEAVAFLEDLRPDVTVVCGTTYLKRPVIEAGHLMINIHGGYLPQYKGNHCVFFAFLRKDYRRIGASLHLVTSRLDGGELVEVVRPEVLPQDNDEHLYDRSVHLAIDRLAEILTVFEAGGGDTVLRTVAQEDTGETFRHRSRKPHLDLWAWLRIRLGLERVPHIPRPQPPIDCLVPREAVEPVES